MPLTPEDVSRKKFTAVRLREGYDTVEVDAFLEEVEAELVRLNRENAELRTKLETAQVGAATPAAAPAPDQAPGQAADQAPAASLTSLAQPTGDEQAEESTVRVPGIETIRVSTTAEASAAATRLLEIATRSADELLTDAQTEADSMLTAARTDAARVEQDARDRAQHLDVETSQRRDQLFSALEREQAALSSEVESLRSFEREYRAELKDYFAKQLDALEHPLAHSERFGTTPSEPTAQPAGQPNG